MDPLIRAAREGSEAACAELVRLTGETVRAYLGRHVGRSLSRRVSLADLSQETYARVFRSLADVPDDADLELFRARLVRHAEWVIRDAARSLRHLVGESAAGEEPDRDLCEPPPASSMGDVTRRDEAAWLQRLVGKLDPAYADIVRRRLSGESFAAIAARRGEPEATARKRYERAYRRLRELVAMADEARDAADRRGAAS